MKLKKILALLLAIVMLLGCMPAMAINVSGQNTAVDGTATSVVTVDAEPIQMTVTVPSVLPATVDAKGTVTVATDAKVINKSYGPVAVTTIKAEPVTPWALVGPGYDFAAAKVNSKLVQISIEGNVAGTDGNVPMNSNWVIAGNGESYPFGYGVRIPAQRIALTDAGLSNVVFTVDWYEGGGNTASSTEYSLSLDKDYLAMHPGTAEQVHATTTSETMVALLAAEDADDVSWSTSNANVASVTDGHVEAKNVGTAVIKAEYHGLTATCVAAVAEAPVPLQAIGFSKNKLALYKGESETVLLTYNPDKFTGSADVSIVADSDVVTALPTSLTGVTADQGATPVTITANKAGETTITATATIDGRVITTKMTVEVIVPLESLTIEGPNTVVEEETITLTAVKNPSDAIGEVVWSTSDAGIATVDQNGVVTGVKEGEVTITAECGGIKASWNVTVQYGGPIADYAVLYSDGTLVFQKGGTADSTHGSVLEKYTGFNTDTYSYNTTPWRAKRQEVKIIEFIDKVKPVSTAFWFDDFANLTDIKGIEKLDTSMVTDMSRMFYTCTKLTSLDLTCWDTSNVTSLYGMFNHCTKLSSIDVSGWDTGAVTDMEGMFQNCTALTALNMSLWDTAAVTNMSKMFYHCKALATLDTSLWDTSSVTNMSNMFDGCQSLTTIGASPWDTTAVIYMANMFNGCISLESLDASSWDISSVTSMTYMFLDCHVLATLYVKDAATKSRISSNTSIPSTCTILVGSPA